MDLKDCTNGFDDAIWAEGSPEDQLSAIFIDNLILQMISSGLKEKTFQPNELDDTGTAISFGSVLNRLLFMANLTKEPAETERQGTIKVNIDVNRQSIKLSVTANNSSFTLTVL